MQPSEALTTAAQIAVAPAGFAGVVVAFRSKSLHKWSPGDKFRQWLLLGNALIPLFDCLFGMLLLAIKPTLLSIWHWCSGFSLLLSFPFGFSTWRRLSKLGPRVIKKHRSLLLFFYMVGILGDTQTAIKSKVRGQMLSILAKNNFRESGGVGSLLQLSMPTGERSGLLTHIAVTESGSWCTRMKS